MAELRPRESGSRESGARDSLPTLDLSLDVDALAAQLRSAFQASSEACSPSGLAYISNHGVEVELEGAWPMLGSFFSQQEDAKLQACSTNKALRGYSPALSENFATLVGQVRPNDIVEKFRVGPIRNTDGVELSRGHRSFYFPNTWPPGESSETFKGCIELLYEALSRVALKLSEALAISLGLQPCTFTQSMKHPTSILSANCYPTDGTRAQAECDGPLRIAAHTDVSMFTLVAERRYNYTDVHLEKRVPGESGGLEVLVGGDWQAVSPREHQLIMNIGDCLMDWSSGKLKSALHRVCFPSLEMIRGNGAQKEPSALPLFDRLSVAFFVSPDPDAIVSILDDAGTSGSRPLTYEAWRKKRIRRAMTPKHAVATSENTAA